MSPNGGWITLSRSTLRLEGDKVKTFPGNHRTPLTCEGMDDYRVKFREGIAADDNWYGPYRDLVTAQILELAIARRAAELGVPASVVAHHKDGSEETIWDESQSSLGASISISSNPRPSHWNEFRLPSFHEHIAGLRMGFTVVGQSAAPSAVGPTRQLASRRPKSRSQRPRKSTAPVARFR